MKINLKRDWTIAKADMRVLDLYRNGRVTAEAGALRIAENNNCTCSSWQFVMLATECGWLNYDRK